MEFSPADSQPMTTHASRKSLQKILFGLIVVLLLLAGAERIQKNFKTSPAAPEAPTAPTAPQVILDERNTQRSANLTAQEKADWKEHENTVAEYRFLYPPTLAVEDHGILGATMYPIASLPKIDGVVSPNTPNPINFAYFNVLPVADETGFIKTVSPSYDQEWKSLIGVQSASSAAEKKKLQPFYNARKEVEALSNLRVSEKNRQFERQEDTKFLTFSAKTFISRATPAGFPAEVKELRYLYETPTLTYIFGGYIGGKTASAATSLNAATLQKIFDTAIIQ